MDSFQLKRLACAPIPIEAGLFSLIIYAGPDGLEHLAFTLGQLENSASVLVRVHSECLTGDLLGSQRCDCGLQLQESLRRIGEAGQGALIYLRQEGRGIGLVEKLRAYNLQDEGLDTVEANLHLGHPVDARDYGVAATILKDLKIESIRLLTNNPAKVRGLHEHGVEVAEQLTLQVQSHPHSSDYLRTKASKMDHRIDLSQL